MQTLSAEYMVFFIKRCTELEKNCIKYLNEWSFSQKVLTVSVLCQVIDYA